MTPYSSRVASKESTVNFTSAVPHIYTHRKGFFHSHAKKEREIIWSCPVPRFCWKVGRSVWLLDNEFKGDINCFQEARFFFCIRERVIYSLTVALFCFVLFVFFHHAESTWWRDWWWRRNRSNSLLFGIVIYFILYTASISSLVGRLPASSTSIQYYG